MAEITAALETGTGFEDAVDVLGSNGVEVPEPLTANAETGVATQGALIEAFPDAARDALAEARALQTDGASGTSRVTSFLANQLGARSVEPRDGDDPDAVLSRAEAAVRAGNLQTALDEIATLPEEAQAALADWAERAQTRLETKNAADTLVQRLMQE
nr:mitofilin family membrane protein [Marivita sp. GX14005]